MGDYHVSALIDDDDKGLDATSMTFPRKFSRGKNLAPLHLELLKLAKGFLQEHRTPQHRHSRAGQDGSKLSSARPARFHVTERNGSWRFRAVTFFISFF